MTYIAKLPMWTSTEQKKDKHFFLIRRAYINLIVLQSWHHMKRHYNLVRTYEEKWGPLGV